MSNWGNLIFMVWIVFCGFSIGWMANQTYELRKSGKRLRRSTKILDRLQNGIDHGTQVKASDIQRILMLVGPNARDYDLEFAEKELERLEL